MTHFQKVMRSLGESYRVRDEQIEAMHREVWPRRTWLDRLLRRRELPPSPVVGAIWRWHYVDALTEREADYWKYHLLPWGWSITQW